MALREEEQYLIVLAYQSQATLLYNLLRNKGYDIKLVATPCSLGKGCSRSVRFKGEFLERIKEESRKNNITVKGIYKIFKNEANQTKYVKV